MPANTTVSNPFSTGGGGTSFEHLVGAYFLVPLLLRQIPHGLGSAVSKSVRFQSRQVGAALDDILIIGDDGTRLPSLQLQVKHSLRIAKTDAVFLDTVKQIWEAFSVTTQLRFREGQDKLGIVVGEWKAQFSYTHRLLEKATSSITSQEFVNKVNTPRFASNEERKQLSAFREALNSCSGRPISDDELWRILSHLVFVHLDFEHASSRDSTLAWNSLLDITPRRDPVQAALLFDQLLVLVSRTAPLGGTLDHATVRKSVTERLPSIADRLGADTDADWGISQLREVFVPPAQYELAVSTLKANGIVVVEGPPHSGKTATALMLADTISASEGLRGTVLVRSNQPIPHTFINQDVVLVLDDYFGASTLSQPDVADNFGDIIALSRQCRVIVTSRTQVLSEAKRSTRFGERGDIPSFSIELMQEGSFDSAALEKILIKHLEWGAKLPQQDPSQLTGEQVEQAKSHRGEIIRQLRFPHNIERFCRVQLPQMTNVSQLTTLIEDAKEIIRATQIWTRTLPDSERWFVYLLALFQDLKMPIFSKIYNNALKRLDLGARDPIALVRKLSAYVGDEAHPRFTHPSYREAVISLVRDEAPSIVGPIADLGLAIVIAEDPWSLGRCDAADYGWMRFAPGEPIEVDKYLIPFIETYSALRSSIFPQIANRIAPYDSGASSVLFVTDRDGKGGNLILVPAGADSPKVFVEQPEDPPKRVDGVLDAARDARMPRAAEHLWASDLAKRSPYTHAVIKLREQVCRVVERRRLTEAWPLAHLRIELALRRLRHSWIRLDIDPDLPIDDDSLEIIAQTIQDREKVGCNPGFNSDAWERMITEACFQVMSIKRCLGVLKFNGRRYDGRLMEKADVQARYRNSCYSPSLLRVALEKGLEYFFESYRYMVESNFSPIAERFALYRSGTVKVLGAIAYGDDFGTDRTWFYFLPSDFETLGNRRFELHITHKATSRISPPEFSPDVKARLRVASDARWIQSFSVGATDFIDADEFIKHVYKCLDDDFRRAVHWDALGGRRTSDLIRKLQGTNVIMDMQTHVDPWEFFDWPT